MYLFIFPTYFNFAGMESIHEHFVLLSMILYINEQEKLLGESSHA